MVSRPVLLRTRHRPGTSWSPLRARYIATTELKWRLTALQFLVLDSVMSHAQNATGIAFVGLRTIASEIGHTGHSHVARTLAELTRLGLLTTVRRGGGVSQQTGRGRATHRRINFGWFAEDQTVTATDTDAGSNGDRAEPTNVTCQRANGDRSSSANVTATVTGTPPLNSPPELRSSNSSGGRRAFSSEEGGEESRAGLDEQAAQGLARLGIAPRAARGFAHRHGARAVDELIGMYRAKKNAELDSPQGWLRAAVSAGDNYAKWRQFRAMFVAERGENELADLRRKQRRRRRGAQAGDRRTRAERRMSGAQIEVGPAGMKIDRRTGGLLGYDQEPDDLGVGDGEPAIYDAPDLVEYEDEMARQHNMRRKKRGRDEST